MIKVPLLRQVHPHSLSHLLTNDRMCQKNVDFDTFDGHVMVNFIETNFQDIIFGPIRVGLITQKQLIRNDFQTTWKNDILWGTPPNFSSTGGLWSLKWASFAWILHKIHKLSLLELAVWIMVVISSHAKLESFHTVWHATHDKILQPFYEIWLEGANIFNWLATQGSAFGSHKVVWFLIYLI
jgi:hypothetical protein